MATEAKELTEEELKQLEESEDIPAPAPTDAPFDDATKRMVMKIPLLATKAGPRDGPKWINRLKEEYQALITVSWVVWECGSNLAAN